MQNIVFLSVPQVISLHDEQIQLYGGMPGVRDRNLLESAVAAPLAGFGGQLFYDTIYKMAGAYFFSLCKNHGFNDGNKRTAVAAVSTFLIMNGFSLEVEEDELVNYTLRVATEKVTNEEIAAFLESHTCVQPTEKA